MTTDLIYASGVLLRDWRNEHELPHTSWITSRHPDRPRTGARQRIAILLIRLGGAIASIPPGERPGQPHTAYQPQQ